MVQLPRNSYPNAIAVSSQGVVWVSEGGADAVAELKDDGAVRQQPIPANETDLSGLVVTSAGTVWVAGFELLTRITGQQVSMFADYGPNAFPTVGVPEAIAATPAGVVWFATRTHGPSELVAITTDGGFINTELPGPPDAFKITGLATDARSDIWFTEVAESRGAPDFIGRLDGATGRYTRWKVPNHESGLQAIARGSGGAMWFTERNAYRLGRISSTGRITEFQLPPGTVPTAITEGSDQGMWFTAETKLGRITGAGKVTLLPIRGAQSLDALASDHGGGFWIADASSNRVYHVVRPG
jgi:streptogramin lyase